MLNETFIRIQNDANLHGIRLDPISVCGGEDVKKRINISIGLFLFTLLGCALELQDMGWVFDLSD